MKRFEAPTEPTGETPDPYEKRRLPMANRKRNIQMKFYVTEEEKRLIDEKMAQPPFLIRVWDGLACRLGRRFKALHALRSPPETRAPASNFDC